MSNTPEPLFPDEVKKNTHIAIPTVRGLFDPEPNSNTKDKPQQSLMVKPLFGPEQSKSSISELSTPKAEPLFKNEPKVALHQDSKSVARPVFSSDSPSSQCPAEKKDCFSSAFLTAYPHLAADKNKATNLAAALMVTPQSIESFGEHLLGIYQKHSSTAGELAHQIEKKQIAETLLDITEKLVAVHDKPAFSWFTKKKKEPLDFDLIEKTLNGFKPYLKSISTEPERVKKSLIAASEDLELHSAILGSLYQACSSLFDDHEKWGRRLHHRFLLLSGSLRGVDSMVHIMDLKSKNIEAWQNEIERLLITTLPPMRLSVAMKKST